MRLQLTTLVGLILMSTVATLVNAIRCSDLNGTGFIPMETQSFHWSDVTQCCVASGTPVMKAVGLPVATQLGEVAYKFREWKLVGFILLYTVPSLTVYISTRLVPSCDYGDVDRGEYGKMHTVHYNPVPSVSVTSPTV